MNPVTYAVFLCACYFQSQNPQMQHPVVTQFHSVTVFSNILPLHTKLHVSLIFYLQFRLQLDPVL
jgi:hypothetical protein